MDLDLLEGDLEDGRDVLDLEDCGPLGFVISFIT